MPKPYGLRMDLTYSGDVRYQTTNPSSAENAIWDAVEEAIRAGMSVRSFLFEAEQAWDETLTKMAKDARKEWPK